MLERADKIFRGIVPIGRTAVSKTDGWEFESLYPCHFFIDAQAAIIASN